MRLAPFIEHTLLRADATLVDVERHCAEALSAGVFGVCVSPLFVRPTRKLVGGALRVVTVAGFPLGTSMSAVKAEEARRAAAEGADEVDMVLAIGLARAGDWKAVGTDIREVRGAIRGIVLKVILETGCLDLASTRLAAEVAADEGADFVKTSTGFGPRGATVEDVALLVAALRGRARVKASGGIRTRDEAIALVHAGADRIGTSAGPAIARGDGA